jgi:hypothetical protein
METNSAIDNLWYLTDDVLPQVLKTGKPKTLSANPEKIYIGRTTKMVGTMVYFLPKDASGKIIGAPQKFLQVKGTKYNNNLLDASKLTPYYKYVASNPTKFDASAVSLAQSKINPMDGAIASSYTGLDDIRNSMNKYGANGNIDLSNIEGIDDSIANCMGMEMDLGFTGSSGKAIAKKDTGRFVSNGKFWQKQKTYKSGTIKNVVDIKIVSLLNPKTNKIEKRNMLIFEDGTAGAPNKWRNESNVYSNLTDESLLDGLTENTSLLNADGDDGEFSNLINTDLLSGLTENTSLLGADGYSDADGDTEYSNTIGDWFKGVFGKKDKDSALNKIADPNVALVDAKTMDKAYKESGSGTTFREWISSEKGRNLIDSVTKFASVFINPTNPKDLGNVGDGSGSGSGSGSGGSGSGGGKPSETKILGMSPITFGIVAFAVIAVGSIVAIKVLKNK